MKGKFIVFEGIDGAGAETQAKKLVEYLKQRDVDSLLLEYPDYQGPIGKLIKEILHGKYNFNVQAFTLLFIADFIKDKEKVEKALNEGKIVIGNRYFTSTLVYETVLGFDRERMIGIAEALNMPKPNLAIYIDISPNTSVERKKKEKSELDKHESNLDFLEKVRNTYIYSVEKNVWTKWVKVDGEKSIEEVFKDVLSVLFSYKIL
ncbi:MAG: dTMP kinase [Candidatus Aenigmarchaeota archaeon]|nr:dTMP kinase [Candidatus Aenigmarchaeota archaeon]